MTSFLDDHTLLTDELTLPEQFYHRRGSDGCTLLLAAVLEEALLLLAKPKQEKGIGHLSSARLRQDAVDWVTSNEDTWPFAFVRICEVLGYDPGALRKPGVVVFFNTTLRISCTFFSSLITTDSHIFYHIQ